jgi:hypothetical protein
MRISKELAQLENKQAEIQEQIELLIHLENVISRFADEVNTLTREVESLCERSPERKLADSKQELIEYIQHRFNYPMRQTKKLGI